MRGFFFEEEGRGGEGEGNDCETEEKRRRINDCEKRGGGCLIVLGEGRGGEGER